MRTVHGFDIQCDASDYVGRQIIRGKDWEPLIGQTIAACAQSGGLCLDVGANIGFHTLVMSRAVGSAGRVVAFEPDMRNLALLIKNIHLNDINNVYAVSLALSDHNDLVRMAIAPDYNYGLSNLREMPDGQQRQPAMVVRGDVLPLLKPGEQISLVKIDVEGLEEQVLCGLSGVLGQVQHLVCEINPDWVDVRNIFSLMKAAGFRHVAAPQLYPQLYAGKWLDPEKQIVGGKHDALFYRNMSSPLAALIE